MKNHYPGPGVVPCILGVVGLLAPSLPAQNLQVSVSAPKEVAPGSRVTITIDLAGVVDLGALVFDVTYDGTSLSLEGVDATGTLAEQGLFASNPETFPSTSGKLTFGFLHAQGLSTGGTLVRLTFKVAKAPLSPATLDLANSVAVGVNLADQAVTESDDEVSVLLGVVNLDSGLRMFTVPVQLTNGDPATVLDIPKEQVKVAAWDPAANHGAGGYVIYDGSNMTFEAGQGYWVKLDAARELRLTAGRGIDPDQPATLPVAKGWTLLGNPRSDALTWSLTDLRVQHDGADAGTLAEAQSTGLVEDYGWVYDGRQYVLVYDPSVVPEAQTSIPAGAAFWLQGHAEGVSLVVPPATRAARTVPPSSGSRKGTTQNWGFRLAVACGGVKDTYNFLGVRPTIRSDSGGLQVSSPPPASHYVDFSFVSSRAPGRRLAADYRSPLKGRTVWDAVVETDVANEDVVLTWNDLTGVPNSYRLTLIDKETGRRHYMRTTSYYKFRSGERGATRQFAVEVDPSSGAALLLTGLHVTPGRDGSAALTFTSTQAALVRVEIRSADGRVAEVLAADFSAVAGVNTLRWSGRRRTGKVLPRGLYVVQLVARTDEGQASRAMTTFSLR